jgi:ADP-heptose:LPS heptosyltransferase
LDSNLCQNVETIKAKNIDFACLPGPSFIYSAMLYLSGIPLVAISSIENGFCPAEILPYRIMKYLVYPSRHLMLSYAPREYLRLLEPIGIFTDDATKHLAFTSESAMAIDQLFTQEGIVATDLLVIISPSAGNKTKQWDARNFAQVADYLYSKYGAKIVLIGAKNDEVEITEMVANLASGTRIINTLNNLSIDETKALFARSNLFISVDTGPVYYAEAFGVPNVNITGPVDEKEQPPISDIHKVIFADVACRPCSFVMNGARSCHNIENPFVCLRLVTPEMVCKQIDELLAISV